MAVLTIDSKQIAAREGQTLLEVAREAGIRIPTLCHHDALEPRGACRLCMVEISNPAWPGWRKLVAACVYPAEDGLVVRTSTPEVEDVRRTVADLLLARCPKTESVRALARSFGVERTSFREREKPDACVLCGICVRVCEDLIGASAIGVLGRGATKRVGPAFGWVAEACIGCGACAQACPTGAIRVRETDGVRRIWGRDFVLTPCRSCGAPTLPREQVEHMAGRAGLPAAAFELCDACRRREIAGRLEAVMGR